MLRLIQTLGAFLLLTALSVQMALAQTPPTILTPVDEDAVIRNHLCLGDLCPSDPTLNFVDGIASSLLIMDTRTRIDTIDTSDDASFPGDDWSFIFNDATQRTAGGMDRFSIANRTEDTIPFQIEDDAPTNAFYLEDSGQIGLGTSSILAALHVFRSDGSAQVLVEETSMDPVPRTLFRLASAGSNAKFEIDNTLAGVNWAFTNSGNDFRMSRQGSGVVEFRVDNNGDAFLEGTLWTNSDRNAKTDIEAVDAAAILEKVVQLPIAEWAYKETPESRHIGPMAQDFYAAFQTGTTDTKLATTDGIGVAIASIQALEQRNRELESKNASLEARIRKLESLEQEITELRALVGELVPRVAQN